MALPDISKLSGREKLLLMEALWQDMRQKADSAPILQEHIDLLNERQRTIDSGENKLLDWDLVKNSLGGR
jgi:hypothetical protein